MYLVPVAKVQKKQILHAFFSEKRRQGDKKRTLSEYSAISASRNARSVNYEVRQLQVGGAAARRIMKAKRRPG